ncbi:hypothetical protein PG991_002299 [Apiospora marii]|uniref:Uncharacterized protein n=1 Tax=Apiospora marii TaxID=335849 RepID=A0ABR1SG95_9PEZI
MVEVMTGLHLSRWPRFARAPRLDHVAGSIRGISSSGSHNAPAPNKYWRGKPAARNGDDAGSRAAPEPTLFGTSNLSKRFDTGGEVTAFYRTHQVCPRHCFDSNHMKYLDKVEHPLRKTMFDLYATWADRPLWYSGAAFGAAPIVCSKAKRWMQRGLREALLERGYDRDGRVRQEKTTTKTPPALYGTLKVLTHNPETLCQQPFSNVLEAMRQAVTAAEPHLVSSQPSQSNGKQNNKQSKGNSPSSSPRPFRKPPTLKARPLGLI